MGLTMKVETMGNRVRSMWPGTTPLVAKRAGKPDRQRANHVAQAIFTPKYDFE